jgi:tRNA nucleotidyltransferase/poly(A) polymerase
VRFSAAFGFQLDAATGDAIRQMADEINIVSAERIAMEMRRMLVEPGRARAVRLLLETHLAAQLLPEIVPGDEPGRQRLARALNVLDTLQTPGFPLSLAALLHEFVDAPAAEEICLRWRLSNKETQRVVWLVEHHAALAGVKATRWSAVQPLLISEGIEDLLALHEAASPAGPDEAAYCRSLLSQPRDVLDPPPLLTGEDLLAHGIPAGPRFKTLLQRIREAQLDGELATAADALSLVDRIEETENRKPKTEN